MNENDTEKTEIAKAADGVDAQLVLVGSFLSETEVLIERLRNLQIPQHVGMAAAGRALSADLPKALIAQVQSDLSSGALLKRWQEAIKRASGDAGEEPEQRIAAVAAVLIELAQRAARYVAVRADEWAGDAYRLEGQANALEGQLQRFHRAREGISRSRGEGAAADARQTQRRQERMAGSGPGHGGGDDGDDA
jgi:hypothetical protein